MIFTRADDIFIQPLCEFFGINILNQQRIIKNDPVLSTSHTKKYDKLVFNDTRKRYCLSKKGFIRWVQL